MEFHLKALIPTPLQDVLSTRHSDIWNQDVALSGKQFSKIIAASGTGKTTLVHYLYHIRYDYTGQVSCNSTPWQDYDATALAAIRQNKLSIVFQDLRLFPQLTARENIELNRLLASKPYYPSSMMEQFAKYLQISHKLDQVAATLSYGERQRVAIIRALMQPFECLLLDEPFSHLDQANAQLAAQLIAQECQKREAGFILTDLDHDTLFAYDHIYQL